MATDRRTGKGLGPTGDTVAENLVRVRRRRGVTLRALSDRLAELGHPMSWSAIGKIENRTRKVDVDDLMALAVALDVSPLGLLLPQSSASEDVVEVTGMHGPAIALWLWAAGRESWQSETLSFAKIRIYSDITDVSLPRWLDLLAVERKDPPVG